MTAELALIFGSITVVLIAIAIGKNVEWHNGRFTVTSGTPKKKNPHAICGHVKDVIQIFRDRDDAKDRISEIEHRHLPKEIMQASEDAIERVTAMLTGYYLSLLKTLGIAAKIDVANTQQFRAYVIILEALRPHMIAECRRMMHENGWIKKEQDGVFDKYVKQKVSDFLTMFTSLMNDYYIIDKPTRIELYEWNMSKVNQSGGIADIIEQTIRHFLVISKNWQKEIDAIKAKMDADMKRILGE